MAHRLCDGLPRNDPGLDSRRRRCKNRAPRPSQGTVNGAQSLNDHAVDGPLNITNQPSFLMIVINPNSAFSAAKAMQH